MIEMLDATLVVAKACIYVLLYHIPILQVLKLGGVFVCQVYELLTRFSAGLVYVLYRLFEEVGELA